jgi:cell division protein FtsZ
MSDIYQETKPQNVFAPIYNPVLKVLGLGGGGGNAVTRMIELGLGGVEFIAANTDLQVLKSNPAPKKILLGPHVTRGLGAGGDPHLGKAAAEESSREIAAALTGADMVFLTAGMGGGTGTGAIPVAAEIARNLGAVTIAIVNTPFSFEMARRQRNATEGLALLQKHSDTLISIPNDRLLYFDTRNLPLELAFRLADDVLRQAVQGISELITEPGMINVDFAHIRRLMKLGGGALMSIGYGEGENKAIKAIEKALHHPLLGSVSLEHAAGIIANFTGGADLTLHEVEAALTGLQEQACSQTEIVMGVINDDRLEDKVQVTLIITGLGAPTLEETLLEVSKPKTAETKIEEPEMVQMAEERSMPNLPPTPLTATPSATDLDLPAFLRRRIRYAG